MENVAGKFPGRYLGVSYRADVQRDASFNQASWAEFAGVGNFGPAVVDSTLLYFAGGPAAGISHP